MPDTQTAPLDLGKIEALSDVEVLAPLIQRRAAIRARLTELHEATLQVGRALHNVEDDPGQPFTAEFKRRHLEGQLAAHAEEGAGLEAELAMVQRDLGDLEEEVKAQLAVSLAAEGVSVMGALTEALTVLERAGQTYDAFNTRCVQLLGHPLAPEGFVFSGLPLCIAKAQAGRERLRQASREDAR